MSKQTKTYLSAIGILQIIVAIVLCISFIPRQYIPHLFNIHEKGELVHFIMYGTFVLVIAAILWQFSIKHWALISFIATFCVGIGIEFLQPLLSNRSCDLFDICFNTIGIFIGLMCAHVYKNRANITQHIMFLLNGKKLA
ncbi:MAG: VanZ family protein [Bacteroidales bacterium]|nr:VanZ family protein [Bacteroidales bacterium]